MSVDQIRLLHRVLVRRVPAEGIDRNHHLDVVGHFKLIVLASERAMASVGLTDDYVARRRLGFFVVEQHLTYHSEVIEGDDVGAYVQFTNQTGKAVGHTVHLVNESADALASTCTFLVLHVDQRTRRTTPIPHDVRSAVDDAIARATNLTR